MTTPTMSQPISPSSLPPAALPDSPAGCESFPPRTDNLAEAEADARRLEALLAEAELLAFAGGTQEDIAAAPGRSPETRQRLPRLLREIDGLLDRMATRLGCSSADLPPIPDPSVGRAPRTETGGATPIRLPAFEELTLDEILAGTGSQAIRLDVRPLDTSAALLRGNGPLGLDVERALDQITIQMQLGEAMGLPLSEALTPSAPLPLSGPDALRIDAIIACMERILANCPGPLLSPAAQTELTALMTEADRLMGRHGGAASARGAAMSRLAEAPSWRARLERLGARVLALLSGDRSSPAPVGA